MKNAIATDKDASVLLMKELFDGLGSEQREELLSGLLGGEFSFAESEQGGSTQDGENGLTGVESGDKFRIQSSEQGDITGESGDGNAASIVAGSTQNGEQGDLTGVSDDGKFRVSGGVKSGTTGNKKSNSEVSQKDIDFLNSLSGREFESLSRSEQQRVEKIFSGYEMSSEYKRELKNNANMVAKNILQQEFIVNGIKNYNSMSEREKMQFMDKACDVVATNMGVGGTSSVLNFSESKFAALNKNADQLGYTADVELNNGKLMVISFVNFAQATSVYDGLNTCGHECMHNRQKTQIYTNKEGSLIKSDANIKMPSNMDFKFYLSRPTEKEAYFYGNAFEEALRKATGGKK